MAARGLTKPVWKIWRQDVTQNGRRMFWYAECEHDTLLALADELRKRKILVLDTLTTDFDEKSRMLVVKGRRPVAISLSSVYCIEEPHDIHFVEYT